MIPHRIIACILISIALASCGANKPALHTGEWVKTFTAISFSCTSDTSGNTTVVGSYRDTLFIDGKQDVISPKPYIFFSTVDRAGKHGETDFIKGYPNYLHIISHGENYIGTDGELDKQSDGWCGTPPFNNRYFRSVITGFSKDSVLFHYWTQGKGDLRVEGSQVLDSGKFALFGTAQPGAILEKDSLGGGSTDFFAILNHSGKIEALKRSNPCIDKINLSERADRIIPLKNGWAFFCSHSPPRANRDTNIRSWYSINGCDLLGGNGWQNTLYTEDYPSIRLHSDGEGNLWLCVQFTGKLNINGKDILTAIPPHKGQRIMFFCFDSHGVITRQYDCSTLPLDKEIDDFAIGNDSICYLTTVDTHLFNDEDDAFEHNFDSLYWYDTVYYFGYNPKYDELNKHHFALNTPVTHIMKCIGFTKLSKIRTISAPAYSLNVQKDGTLILYGEIGFEMLLDDKRIASSRMPQYYLLHLNE